MNIKKLLIIPFLLFVFGVSYAFFQYVVFGENGNEIVAGQIYMKYADANTLYLTNIFPETREKALSEGRTDNEIRFSIKGKNEYKKDIYYEINLNFGDEIENSVFASFFTAMFTDKIYSFNIEEYFDLSNGTLTEEELARFRAGANKFYIKQAKRRGKRIGIRRSRTVGKHQFLCAVIIKYRFDFIIRKRARPFIGHAVHDRNKTAVFTGKFNHRLIISIIIIGQSETQRLIGCTKRNCKMFQTKASVKSL